MVVALTGAPWPQLRSLNSVESMKWTRCGKATMHLRERCPAQAARMLWHVRMSHNRCGCTLSARRYNSLIVLAMDKATPKQAYVSATRPATLNDINTQDVLFCSAL